MVYVMFQAITLEDTDLLLSSLNLEAFLFRPLFPSLVSSPPRVPGDSNYPEGALQKKKKKKKSYGKQQCS